MTKPVFFFLLSIMAFPFLAHTQNASTTSRTIELEDWVVPANSDNGQSFVLIDFWATWCKPCIQSMPHMESLYQALGEEVLFIGISNEPKEKVEQFLYKYNYKLPIAIDYKKSTARQFGVISIPRAIFLAMDGTVLYDGHPESLNEKKLRKLMGKHSPKKGKQIKFHIYATQ